MRVLHLYRPRLPSLRAQAIQVVHVCHALAAAGHEVTLLADSAPASAGNQPGPDEVLAAFGLRPEPRLDLRLSPWQHKTPAGLWFRQGLSRWWRGAPGVVLARDKSRLLAALHRHGRGPGHRVVLEAHELDSAQAAEAGRDPAPARELERALLPWLDALVTNCGGTLAAWEAAYASDLPARRQALQNATAPGRAVTEDDPELGADEVIRVVGSPKHYKDAELLVALGGRLPLPLEVVGGSDEERSALVARNPALMARGPVPYPAVPRLLARSRVLLLPLQDNLFGRQLSSPLKLWDYLATPVPVVAPDLPSIREIASLAGASLHWYRPGDAVSAAEAVGRALTGPLRQPFLRTWNDRAAELTALVRALGAAP